MDINLVLFKTDGSRKSFPLPSSVTVIGRRPDCDLYIPLTSISKRHCQLNRDQGVLRVRDLGSRNGTYLNGKRINEAVVQAGDSINVGPLTFVFQINGQPKIISMPDRRMQKSQQEGASIDGSTVYDGDASAERDDSDSLE